MKPISPAHPFLADTLCTVGANFADSVEPMWLALGVFVRRLFWALFVVVPFALLIASSLGLLA